MTPDRPKYRVSLFDLVGPVGRIALALRPPPFPQLLPRLDQLLNGTRWRGGVRVDDGTRLTNAFSKKLAHLKAAITLHFARIESGQF